MVSWEHDFDDSEISSVDRRAFEDERERVVRRAREKRRSDRLYHQQPGREFRFWKRNLVFSFFFHIFFPGPHPFHVHGHEAWLLGSGVNKVSSMFWVCFDFVEMKKF